MDDWNPTNCQQWIRESVIPLLILLLLRSLLYRINVHCCNQEECRRKSSSSSRSVTLNLNWLLCLSSLVSAFRWPSQQQDYEKCTSTSVSLWSLDSANCCWSSGGRGQTNEWKTAAGKRWELNNYCVKEKLVSVAAFGSWVETTTVVQRIAMEWIWMSIVLEFRWLLKSTLSQGGTVQKEVHKKGQFNLMDSWK